MMTSEWGLGSGMLDVRDGEMGGMGEIYKKLYYNQISNIV